MACRHCPEHCSETERLPTGPDIGTQVMIRLPGNPHSFRCECGGNVFTKIEDFYRCNSCSKEFVEEINDTRKVICINCDTEHSRDSQKKTGFFCSEACKNEYMENHL